MGHTIIPIRLGVDHCYLIRADKCIMIDAGSPGQGDAFLKAITAASIKPEDIKLIVITHGHWDHIGSAKILKEMTGAKIAMHRKEKDWLENSLKPLPPGVTMWGRIFAWILAIFVPVINIPATNVDIVLEDTAFPLTEYGIQGKIIHTPGHSAGSVSVLLETGDAFVGDLAMNGLPLRLSPGLPILAEDLPTVRKSWKMLLNEGAERIYPGHGKPFSADVIRKALSEGRI